MTEDNYNLLKEIKEIKSNISSIKKVIKKEHKYNRELQKYHAFEAATIAFLVAIAVSSFTYILSPKSFVNIWDFIFFIIMMMASICSLLLILFHAYSIYGILESKKKIIPYAIDYILLFYIIIGIPMLILLVYIYDYFNISSEQYSPGWIFVIIVLIAISIIAIISSKYIEKKIKEKFPNIFK